MRNLLFPIGDVEVPRRVVNVASVPQRSPFRYPGGKTWMIPRFRQWLQSFPKKPRVFVEPFAGGGIVSLTVAMEELANKVVMAELDADVAAVWETILEGDYKRLIKRIVNFPITRERVIDELSRTPSGQVDRAFQTILRNRVQRGGILAPGAGLVKNGENGKGVASRWYPRTLMRRILAIASVRAKIEFHHDDAMNIIPGYVGMSSAAFFIDPPYTAGGKRAGKRLYAFNEVDHEKLFRVLSRSKGNVMITYDNCPTPRLLAEKYGYNVDLVPMSNTHHATMLELVITK